MLIGNSNVSRCSIGKRLSPRLQPIALLRIEGRINRLFRIVLKVLRWPE